jgi:hypothetical protein
MAFTWNGRYVLRRVEDDDPDYHRIYKHSESASEITSADNVFSSQPALATKSKFEAFRVDTAAEWTVALTGNPNATMAVFQLRSRS